MLSQKIIYELITLRKEKKTAAKRNETPIEKIVTEIILVESRLGRPMNSNFNFL